MRAADFDRLAEKLYPAVLDAGLLEMQHFKTGVPIETKSDRSPVTVADREAEAVILAALAQIAPDLPVVAEEAVSAGHIPAPSNEFFLVDALDGTRLFIRGKPEFSVNIGLVQNRRPVFGMIYVPPTGDLFYKAADGRAVRANAPWSLADRIAFSALTRHTAAGQAILEAAGGTVTIDGGTALTYGKAAATYRNPHFVAWAREPLIADFGRHHG